MRSAILSFLSILLWQSTVVPATAQSEKTTVSGPAEVVTASVLEVGGMQLRLYGIAAPQKGERCPLNGRDIDCGHVAATQLMDLTAGATVTCEIQSEETEPPTAKCLAEDYDLSEGMVYTGWARPLVFAPDTLKEVQETARTRRHGLWAGDFPPSVKAVAYTPEDSGF